ncbi:adenosylcobinamide-GDP ribazoletransferase [Psychrobacter lutiphocae]|uniref:adenosylcobinamide-GDP ribazoletransferase n=1 Tax=Psychrobacter lutiphocae TaxID=540500 RepID=UPI00036FBAB7|nr:adenosylcobinamide-GDP ribazoletransferase [Psychrobacter lutiphocae]
MSSIKPSSKQAKPSVTHEWRLLLVAIQFLTRIPVNIQVYQPDWLHKSSRHFPAVGILVGVLCALVFWLCGLFFGSSVHSSLISAVVTTAFGIKLTGAFHEDGLADTCDGLGGGLTRERTLIIMKDSRIGTYGTLGLVCVLLIKISLLASMPVMTALVALIVAHCASRLLCTSLIVFLPYGGEVAHAKAKPMAQQMTLKQWLASSLWLFIVFVLLWLIVPMAIREIAVWQWVCAGVLAILTALYMYHLLQRRLNGYTGDGLGATQQLTEVAIYAGLCVSLPNF